MAGKVLTIKICSAHKLCSGLTGNKPPICHCYRIYVDNLKEFNN